jgi:hypothetical protein
MIHIEYKKRRNDVWRSFSGSGASGSGANRVLKHLYYDRGEMVPDRSDQSGARAAENKSEQALPGVDTVEGAGVKNKRVALIRVHVGVTAAGNVHTSFHHEKHRCEMELWPMGVYVRFQKNGEEHVIPYSNVQSIQLLSAAEL